MHLFKLFSILLFSSLVVTPYVHANHQLSVKGFVDAFNQKNVSAMLRFTHQDVRWLFVDEKQLLVETSDQISLESAMKTYLLSVPSAHSTIMQSFRSGDYVSTVERVRWVSKGKEKQQCSMAVYKFSKEKIQTVWYYPAHQCDAN